MSPYDDLIRYSKKQQQRIERENSCIRGKVGRPNGRGKRVIKALAILREVGPNVGYRQILLRLIQEGANVSEGTWSNLRREVYPTAGRLTVGKRLVVPGTGKHRSWRAKGI